MTNDVVRTVIFVNVNPLLRFLCSEIRSLIRSSVVQNIRKINKVFYESMNDGASRNIISMYIPNIYLFQQKGLCPLSHEGSSLIESASQQVASWLVPPRKGAK